MIQRSRSLCRNLRCRPAAGAMSALFAAVLCCRPGGAQTAAPPAATPAASHPTPSSPLPSGSAQDSPPPVFRRKPAVTTSTQGTGSPFSLPQVGGPLDPLRPHLTQMLMRGDVRGELHLTPAQQDALDALKLSAESDIRRFARQDAKRIQDLRTGDEGLSSSERLARAHEVIVAIQQDHILYESETDKRAVALLTPPQVKRLVELDLQWRGPLALAAPNLADTLALSDAQRGEAQAGADAFAALQQAALHAAAAALRPSAPPASPGKSEDKTAGTARVQNERGTSVVEIHASMVSLTPEQIRARDLKTVTVLQSVQPARQESEAKILALLTPEQREQWKALLGRPFVFRRGL